MPGNRDMFSLKCETFPSSWFMAVMLNVFTWGLLRGMIIIKKSTLTIIGGE